MFSDRDPANHPDNNRFSTFGSNLAPSDGTGEGGWFSKYGMKLAGIGGGIGAVFFGFWSCFTIYPLCILAGILQICAGLLVIALEAPLVFFCVDFIPKMVAKVDGRPIWQKTLLYIVVAILPLLLCFVPFTFIGSGFIFLVAIMYGMKVVGPKASRDDMAAVAGTTAYPDFIPKLDSKNSGLVGNIQGQDVEATKKGNGLEKGVANI